ncbi:uncharacterized protein MONBRDRAFT_38501, partial [Monosiga brevicollis MX1]
MAATSPGARLRAPSRDSLEGTAVGDDNRVTLQKVTRIMDAILAAGDGPEAIELTKQLTSPSVVDSHGQTLLHRAAHAGHECLVGHLLACSAPLEMLSAHGLTPLHMAAAAGNLTVVQQLLAAGASPNVQSFAGFASLHFAALRGHQQVAEALLRAGARRATTTNFGWQPSRHALLANPDMSKLLCKDGHKSCLGCGARRGKCTCDPHSAASADNLDRLKVLHAAGVS